MIKFGNNPYFRSSIRKKHHVIKPPIAPPSRPTGGVIALPPKEPPIIVKPPTGGKIAIPPKEPPIAPPSRPTGGVIALPPKEPPVIVNPPRGGVIALPQEEPPVIVNPPTGGVIALPEQPYTPPNFPIDELGLGGDVLTPTGGTESPNPFGGWTFTPTYGLPKDPRGGIMTPNQPNQNTNQLLNSIMQMLQLLIGNKR